MNWTRETPTKLVNPKGDWYWVRTGVSGAPRMAHIIECDGRIVWDDGYRFRYMEGCEWAGPIPEPGEEGS